MTELKTLKDLGVGLISQRALRTEVVKWVKGFEQKQEEYYNTTRGGCEDFFGLNMEVDWEESSEQAGAISFIKHFFNLTKEDLEEATE